MKEKIAPTITAYSYLRFSTHQEIRGDSRRRQLEAGRLWCKTHKAHMADSMEDLGISAYRGQNSTYGQLKRFLDLIDAGQVAMGSFLLVECLDRLSRAEVLSALGLFTHIINAGITVVTLSDGKEYNRQSVNANPMDLMYSVMVMARANEESAANSRRASAWWIHTRCMARIRPVSFNCPSWLRLNRETMTYEIDHDRAAIVRRIVKMATEGVGASAIVHTLSQEKIPTLRRRSSYAPWHISTVKCLLKASALVGDLQFYRVKGSTSVPEGDPIRDYYPALISRNEFCKMQAVLKARQTSTRGRTGRQVANLFGGILVSGEDGGTMILSHRHRQKTIVNMISTHSALRLSQVRAFNYHAFERTFLGWIRTLDVRELSTPNLDRKTTVDRLAEVQRRIAVTRRSLEADGAFTNALEVLQRLIANETELTAALEQAATLIAPPEQQIKQALDDRLDGLYQLQGDQRTNARFHVRVMLQQLVKQIRVFIYGNYLRRIAIAEVGFNSGMIKRLVILRIRRKHGALVLSCEAKGSQLNQARYASLAARLLDHPIEIHERWSHWSQPEDSHEPLDTGGRQEVATIRNNLFRLCPRGEHPLKGSDF